MKKEILTGIFFVFAALCVIYSIIIKATRSGTNFFIVWIGMGILFAGLGLSTYFGVWTKIPGACRKILMIMACVCLLIFVVVEGLIISKMNASGVDGLDYIIVLGAQVRENGPSSVLKYRLDRALQYLNDNPNTICIVSGGQGSNEPFPEADGMADYLKHNGIATNRIILERESKTTEQNILNSKKYIPENASVGIVTNNFHVYRALQIAKKEGLQNDCGIAAGATKLYLPNNMFREFFAEIKWIITSLTAN